MIFIDPDYKTKCTNCFLLIDPSSKECHHCHKKFSKEEVLKHTDKELQVREKGPEGFNFDQLVIAT